MDLRLFQALPSEEYCIFIDLGEGLFRMIEGFNNEEDAIKYIDCLKQGGYIKN